MTHDAPQQQRLHISQTHADEQPQPQPAPHPAEGGDARAAEGASARPPSLCRDAHAQSRRVGVGRVVGREAGEVGVLERGTPAAHEERRHPAQCEAREGRGVRLRRRARRVGRRLGERTRPRRGRRVGRCGWRARRVTLTETGHPEQESGHERCQLNRRSCCCDRLAEVGEGGEGVGEGDEA
jgi:hypothetical protein